MRNELRRSLFAAALAGVALADCGGIGSNFDTPAPSPSPSPSPSPPPSSAGSYFVTGHGGTGFGSSQNTIGFFDSPQAVNPYPLVVVDPLAATPTATQFENEISTLDVANLSEWFPDASGNATAWGVRYRIYAKHNNSGVDNLFKIDLRKSGSAPPTPAPTQLSSALIAGSGSQPALCWFDHQVFDNYRSADQSWIVFHAVGTVSHSCGTAGDQFVAVEASMGATTAPVVLIQSVMGQSTPNQLQPVEALYDATGLITGFLAISHPPVDAFINPTAAVPVVQLTTGMVVTQAFTRKLTGLGVSGGSGDFLSLGVSPGGIWLYRDSSDIWAVDVASNVSTKVYTVRAGDFVHGRAVFDNAAPTMAYVSIDNRSFSSTGAYVLQINTSTKTATAQPPDAAATGGIGLVGVSSSNVVYLFTDRSAIKALNKANLTSTPNVLFTGTATVSVDGPLGSSTGTPPVAYMVQDEVYFTVADSSTGNKLAYEAGAGATPVTGAAIGTGSGAVLGTIAGTFATSGPVATSGALLVTTGAFSTALTYSGATLANYGAAGSSAATLGHLPTTTKPMTPLDVSTMPMQAGVPAMLEMTGGSAQAFGQPVDDVGVFVPNANASFKRVTNNLQ
jgi:hypothetical protein